MEAKKLKKVKEFIKNNKSLLICFLVVTFFFCWQNYWQRGWDFSVYVLNGKYFFHNGEYFEVYRAPMTPFLLGIFWFFGEIGNFIYIIFVSSIFLISIILLSDFLFQKYFKKQKTKKEEVRLLFYLLILTPFTIFYSLIGGTELLALSFFILFVVAFLSNKISGHYLALSFLTRYNFMFFIPFLFFSKSIKKISRNIFSFFVVVFPWLLFNYLKYGNWLTSILDSYYLNIWRRKELFQQFNFLSLFYVSNFYTIFLLLGLFYFFVSLYKKRSLKETKYESFFMIVFLLFLYDVIKTPFKIDRYMFSISLPFAFFSVVGVLKTKKEYLRKAAKIFVLIVFFISIFYLTYLSYNSTSLNSLYKESALKIKELGLEKCKILSHHWAPLAYYTGNARFQYLNLDDAIKENKISAVFLKYPTIDDLFKIEEVKNYPTLYIDDNFAIIGKKENCSKREKTDYPMIKEQCSFISLLLKERFQAKRLCLFFNKK